MKKMFLVMFGLIAISVLFLAGCTTGEAIKSTSRQCLDLKNCNFITSTDVIDTLNKCTVGNIYVPDKQAGYTCNDRCAEMSKKCALGYRAQLQTSSNRVTGLVGCGESIDKEATDIQYDCYCC
jgi:hypothetical protein